MENTTAFDVLKLKVQSLENKEVIKLATELSELVTAITTNNNSATGGDVLWKHIFDCSYKVSRLQPTSEAAIAEKIKSLYTLGGKGEIKHVTNTISAWRRGRQRAWDTTYSMEWMRDHRKSGGKDLDQAWLELFDSTQLDINAYVFLHKPNMQHNSQHMESDQVDGLN